MRTLLSDWRPTDGVGYRALADRIRLLAIDGRIAVGTRLPAERELSSALGVSRTTLAAALDDLRATGHIVTRRGSGSAIRVPDGRRSELAPQGAALDFATASSPATPAFEAAAARALSGLAPALTSSGYELIGLPRLREAIAAHFVRRGLPTRPSQILVTSGAQPALALLARTLVSRGDRALVETPGYPHAHEALRAAGARLLPLPVDADTGWDIGEGEQLLRRAAPALAYFMPDFHNPTGRSLSVEGRERFIGAAHDVGATVIVDETTAELDIDRVGSFPPLASFGSTRSRVITVGSASKTMWGGLRVGWIRASEDVIAALAATRPIGDLGTAVLDQVVTAELFDDIDAVLAHRRRESGAARDAIVAAVAERLPDWRVPSIDGGLAAWVRFDSPVSSQLAIGARARGLRIAAGPWFGLDGAFERFIRIPFGPGADAAVEAVGILADVWADVADAPRSLEQPLAAVV
ncbi:PLP-dependent aminotransferase family protein [Herbiconiux sp. L3-i23]|uniref:MocR-like transcription factor YczR n=1 Tax=Herbiconiux sp. L3-i23 TaxID=2905871 RepID=UPI0020743C33|nr:PLP-dependent aminotransferase family protein [Herbiconiux sp. L3-i23]